VVTSAGDTNPPLHAARDPHLTLVMHYRLSKRHLTLEFGVVWRAAEAPPGAGVR